MDPAALRGTHELQRPRKDVVIIGLGWTGAIMASELTDEGLDVIAIGSRVRPSDTELYGTRVRAKGTEHS